MLARKSLIPLKREFGRIRAGAKRYNSPPFGLLVSFWAKNGPQVAFIVSKKVERRSVGRHEIKRKLADAVAPFLLQLRKRTELVFLAKQRALAATRDQLQKEIAVVLKRERLLQ